ncbi:NDR1/HIN1-like protein 3 [Silene latifolia]|uniref:NDR1/HIN1-like protein 3 n=1 Tax=Silene latifolia TaxID=37657 RepID=UPI003D78AC5F
MGHPSTRHLLETTIVHGTGVGTDSDAASWTVYAASPNVYANPHGLKFKVTDAALTTFNFNTNNLNFNMAVNFTVRNPNRRMGVYYDDIQANLNYGWHRLKTIEAMTFYQGHKNTSSLGTLVFKGQNVVILGSDEKLKFDKQSKDGLYEIQVKFHLRVTFKVGIIKSGNWKPKVKCNLKVPLLGNSSQIFQETKCNYYF